MRACVRACVRARARVFGSCLGYGMLIYNILSDDLFPLFFLSILLPINLIIVTLGLVTSR